MNAAGVLIFTGGLDDPGPVFSVDASSGTRWFTELIVERSELDPSWTV